MYSPLEATSKSCNAMQPTSHRIRSRCTTYPLPLQRRGRRNMTFGDLLRVSPDPSSSTASMCQDHYQDYNLNLSGFMRFEIGYPGISVKVTRLYLDACVCADHLRLAPASDARQAYTGCSKARRASCLALNLINPLSNVFARITAVRRSWRDIQQTCQTSSAKTPGLLTEKLAPNVCAFASPSSQRT